MFHVVDNYADPLLVAVVGPFTSCTGGSLKGGRGGGPAPPIFGTKVCSVLGKCHLGAKRDFEIWAFKFFFSLDAKTPLRMASRGSDLNIKMGQNKQEIHHKE